MKNAIILHGTGNTPHDCWYPYIQNHLKQNGYSVWVPELPKSERPELQASLPFVLEGGTFNEHTVVIGHSSGATLVLALLEVLDAQIAQAVLVAGFYHSLDDEGYSDLMLKDAYDWKKIKTNAREIVCINSDNDPWRCDDIQARNACIKMGGILVVPTGQGHMGSEKFNQPYKEFPLLARLVISSKNL
jgi:hypothetical protein